MIRYGLSHPLSIRAPLSYRSGNLSQRSSVSSVRKGILKKSPSSTTINMEMAKLDNEDALEENTAVCVGPGGEGKGVLMQGFF